VIFIVLDLIQIRYLQLLHFLFNQKTVTIGFWSFKDAI